MSYTCRTNNGKFSIDKLNSNWIRISPVIRYLPLWSPQEILFHEPTFSSSCNSALHERHQERNQKAPGRPPQSRATLEPSGFSPGVSERELQELEKVGGATDFSWGLHSIVHFHPYFISVTLFLRHQEIITSRFQGILEPGGCPGNCWFISWCLEISVNVKCGWWKWT
jgi:hypothetical protein